VKESSDEILQGQKHALRQRFLKQREALSEEERRILSLRICENLWKVVPDALSLAAYMPIRGEVDVRPLMLRWLERGRRLFLPRVRGRELEMVEVTDLKRDLAPGRFGILEPRGEGGSELPLVVLVPGVVFDREGYRIGYGAGFYDRFLAAKGERVAIGVAYRFQIVDSLPHDEHDRKMMLVVCEEGYYKL